MECYAVCYHDLSPLHGVGNDTFQDGAIVRCGGAAHQTGNDLRRTQQPIVVGITPQSGPAGYKSHAGIEQLPIEAASASWMASSYFWFSQHRPPSSG